MKIAAVFGAVLSSVALLAGPALANKVPKTFSCEPIEGNTSPAHELNCDVWVTTGEFAGSCECEPGFTLVDPTDRLLNIQDENSTASPGKASGS